MADPKSFQLSPEVHNDLVARDDRVETVMLPVSDGVTLLRKR